MYIRSLRLLIGRVCFLNIRNVHVRQHSNKGVALELMLAAKKIYLFKSKLVYKYIINNFS